MHKARRAVRRGGYAVDARRSRREPFDTESGDQGEMKIEALESEY
ncbi:MAG TPA: hypothetical protein VMU68_13425 [Acidimicrobiales bacterium]|nr:hypothetical protein [Acidimicrobiales bacterium]